MSDRYDRNSRRHGIWSHWVPLVLTVTVATIGVAAWAWSQRSGNDDKEEEEAAIIQQDLDYENADYGDNPPYGATSRDTAKPPPSLASGELRPGEVGKGTTQAGVNQSEASWGARMSGALRRTPSPQQFLGNAGKTMAAGMAAAGAAVGSALASIREDDRNAYADHETWSEEADAKDRPAAPSAPKDGSKRRKTVAIVVSADAPLEDVDEDGFHEHAVGKPEDRSSRKPS